jgi:hypothetical protein
MPKAFLNFIGTMPPFAALIGPILGIRVPAAGEAFQTPKGSKPIHVVLHPAI